MQKITIKKIGLLVLGLSLAVLGVFGLSTSVPIPEIGEREHVENTSDPLPNASGSEAVKHLKAIGEFESLGAAVIAARYEAQQSGDTANATNQANHIRATFSPDGLLLESTGKGSAWHSRWRLKELGHGDERFAVGIRAVETSGNQIKISHTVATTERLVEEWFYNTPQGLEHGFTIPQRLSQSVDNLLLSIAIEGDLKAVADEDGQNLKLVNRKGELVLNYEKLKVWDANGVPVPAIMTVDKGNVVLEVEDAFAEYPLTIDPTFAMTAKVTAFDGAGDFSQFGKSVAISGDTVVVGAPNDTIANDHFQGSAYVFVRGTNGLWTHQAKLFDPNGAANDHMGESVSISGNTAIVGAPDATIGTDNQQGAIYVYLRTGGEWLLQQKVFAADGLALDRLAIAVDISGETMIAGSTHANANKGAAYVFVRNSGVWTQQQKLIASDASVGNVFGISVAIAQSTAIVGSSFDSINGDSYRGSAYVFDRNGAVWTQQAKLFAADGGANDYFGSTVDIATGFLSAATAVVGVYGDEIDGRQSQGSAYVFTRSDTTWTLQQKLTAADGAAHDFFGETVAISGGTIVVAATLQGDLSGPTSLQGAAYFYTRNSGSFWTQRQKLVAYDAAEGDQFGRNAIGLSSGTVILGAQGNDSAYIYEYASKPFDFDDDGKTDIGIFRPASGDWWINRSSTGQTVSAHFGQSSDQIIPADFTGDFKTDIAIWRPATGSWFVLRSEDSSYFAVPFGTVGDIPTPGDFDGDGNADFAVFRPSSSTWFISQSSGGPTRIFQFGIAGDVPVVADYDADGKDDIGIFRPGPREWWIARSSSGVLAMQFGNAGDKPVQGDYTGDGKADVAIWRPSTGEWLIVRSENFSFYGFPFGATGDVPSPGDYDADGKFDPALFRPSSGVWFIGRSTAGTQIVQFGVPGDKPLPNAFVP